MKVKYVRIILCHIFIACCPETPTVECRFCHMQSWFQGRCSNPVCAMSRIAHFVFFIHSESNQIVLVESKWVSYPPLYTSNSVSTRKPAWISGLNQEQSLSINSTGLSVETFGEFWNESTIEIVFGTVAEGSVQDMQRLTRYLLSLLFTSNRKLILQFWPNDELSDESNGLVQYVIQVEHGSIFAFSVQNTSDLDETFLPVAQPFDTPESLLDAIGENEFSHSESVHYSIHIFEHLVSEDMNAQEPPAKKARMGSW